MKGFVSVYKLYVKCSEPRRLGEASLHLGNLVFGQTLVSCPYLLVLSKYKNVSKKNRMV